MCVGLLTSIAASNKPIIIKCVRLHAVVTALASQKHKKLQQRSGRSARGSCVWKRFTGGACVALGTDAKFSSCCVPSNGGDVEHEGKDSVDVVVDKTNVCKEGDSAGWVGGGVSTVSTCPTCCSGS